MDPGFRDRYRRDFTRQPTDDHPARPPHRQGITEPLPQASQALAQHPTHHHQKKRFIKPILIGLLVIALIAGGTVYYFKFYKASQKHYFPSYIRKDQVNIAVYYPVNLPPGFQVNNDFKLLQDNILYYSVSDSAGTKFYVTIQALPVNFNFQDFKKKFTKPDEYPTAAGDALVGQVGSSVLGSIRTIGNSWIIINSTNLNSVNGMEAVTRAMQPVQLD
jgi:hypothetical protein